MSAENARVIPLDQSSAKRTQVVGPDARLKRSRGDAEETLHGPNAASPADRVSKLGRAMLATPKRISESAQPQL